MTAPLLSVEDLYLAFGAAEVVRGVSFEVNRNETLALVGESGSGKSATALAILRLIEREGGRITRGRIRLGGEEPAEITSLSDRDMQLIRGRLISMVFQEPLTALNPVLTIGRQIRETIERHEALDRRSVTARCIELLDQVRIPSAAQRLRQYPHELSGGQRQRVMLAMALACRPKLLIADEPSTALDVSTQAEILALIRQLQRDTDLGVLFITHDMGVVAEMADRVAVMRSGRIIEQAPKTRLLRAPQAPYTQELLTAAPRLGAGAPPPVPPSQPVLEVENLVTDYAARRPHPLARRGTTRAVNGVSLTIGAGETLGLVGESGCGKSSLARAILRLAPITSGRVRIGGLDVTRLGRRSLFPVRRNVQVVFQDPFAALNPRLPTWFLVSEPAFIHSTVAAGQRRALAARLLEQVGLGAEHIDRYPHQFSGGQRQRLCIARALSADPQLIIADEPVAALDVSIARQITDLLRDLQKRLGLSFLFISHDLAVVECMSHRIAVMHRGQIVETGPTGRVISAPEAEYTQMLLRASPADPDRRQPGSVTEAPPERAASPHWKVEA